MERLTGKRYHNKLGYYAKCSEDCRCEIIDCGDCREFDKLVDRLGAYEDTGLTPSQCAELARAEKEGRLVVLPCKPLDTVYSLFCGEIVEKRIGAITINGYTNPRIWVELYCDFLATQTKRWDLAVGKEFYLTREEAEQALKEAKEDGEVH